MKSILALTMILGGVSASAHAVDLCSDPRLSETPIQVDGRVIPLGSHAGRTRDFLLGKGGCSSMTSTEFYCRLATGKEASLGEGCGVALKFEHQETQALLGVEKLSVDVPTAKAHRDAMLSRLHELNQAGEKGSGRVQDLEHLLMRLDRYQALVEGADWRILARTGEWMPYSALAAGTGDGLRDVVFSQESRLSSAERSGFKIEGIYDRLAPFRIAGFVALLGFLMSLLAPRARAWRIASIITLALLFVIEAGAITMRVLISGRAPITNMYETVMVAGFGAFLIAAVIGFVRKDPRLWSAAFGGVAVSLFLMNFATSMLDGSIQPLVPVLRDNFWLSTHVTSVILSYACFSLSWLLSNYVLLRWLFGARSEAFVDGWNPVIRLAIQIGTVFLATGVLLGGIWADYSWGRFWGWDPKETWSLIALIVYVAILHGRYVGWFRGVRFTLVAAASYLSVIMAWFGVNFILAVGLHSYGFSSGGAFFIATLTAAQLAVLAAVGAALFAKREGRA